jgi:hypothetical protein
MHLELRVCSFAGTYGICGGQSDTETFFPSRTVHLDIVKVLTPTDAHVF